ncbi:hypothetical protein H5410_001887 [Solanum commersonii]|uniref:Uncharacterized protein n=1 Tax=Solanum commersonii TaxID=4109 RepID=A0A9J6B0U2_SOLCO|nr:hypothetical protein H5410_001887 [Solanum commersonii]
MAFLFYNHHRTPLKQKNNSPLQKLETKRKKEIETLKSQRRRRVSSNCYSNIGKSLTTKFLPPQKIYLQNICDTYTMQSRNFKITGTDAPATKQTLIVNLGLLASASGSAEYHSSKLSTSYHVLRLASTIIISPSSSRIVSRSLSLRSSSTSSPTSVKDDAVDTRTTLLSRNSLPPISPSKITSSSFSISSSSSCGNLCRQSGQVLLRLSQGTIQSL